MRRVVVLAAVAAGLISQADLVQACPFCPTAQQTYSEVYEQSSIAVVAVWVSAQRPDEKRIGKTTYRITQVLQDVTGKFKADSELVLDRFRSGKPGDRFLILATRGETVEWGSPLEATPELIEYIVGVPRGKPGAQRLPYFMKFLEHSQESIADDAFAEFANAPFKEIATLTDQFPREKLHKWVTDPATRVNRLGVYGMMLGMCGRAEDAVAMEKKILEPVAKDSFRLGIDGIVAGYLLLTKVQGLEKLEKEKLKDREAPFSEVYAVMQALRFLWQYAPGTIPQQRLRESMRLLLDRPELADVVIADLARWRDWGVQEQLVKLYGQPGYTPYSTRRAIVRYLLVSQKDMPKDTKEPPEHVTRAREYLAEIRKKDPKTVSDVERFPPL